MMDVIKTLYDIGDKVYHNGNFCGTVSEIRITQTKKKNTEYCVIYVIKIEDFKLKFLYPYFLLHQDEIGGKNPYRIERTDTKCLAIITS